MKESLMKGTEELIQEKNKFVRELELLDERRAALATELKQLNHEREVFNDWRRIGEEKLRNQSLKMRVDIQQVTEELRLKKEALEKEHFDFSRVLENRRQVLEEMEEKLQEKEREIERGKLMKQNLLKSSNFCDKSNFPKEIPTKRRKLETHQFEIQNIDAVQKNLMYEHEVIKERNDFLAVAEQCNICKNCGVTVDEFDSIGLQAPSRSVTQRNILLEEPMDGSQPMHLSGHLPSLRKCSVLLNSSPREIAGHPVEDKSSKPTSLDGEASEAKADYRPDRANSGIGVRDSKASERLYIDGNEPGVPLGIADTSVGKQEGKPNISSNNVQDKGNTVESRTLSAKQRGELRT